MESSAVVQQTRPFRPWRKGFLGGTALMAAGALLLTHASHNQPLALAELIPAIGFLGCGGLWFRSALRRWTGKSVEQRSIKSLSLPEGWTVTPNYAIKGAGDVDLLIESPTGARYAIEIKSVADISIQRGFLFLTRSRLTRGNGKRLSDDPLPQTISNAVAVDAIPVLWCPKARPSKPVKVNGVLVVLGQQKQLKKALGASRGLFS
jgi:hypothetical protein